MHIFFLATKIAYIAENFSGVFTTEVPVDI